MHLRYGIEDLSFISRMFLQDDLHTYYATAKALTISTTLGNDPMTIPFGKVVVFAGGRNSIATDYTWAGPTELMCNWSQGGELMTPNVQVIRKKQMFGANFTAVVFGAIRKPNDKDNKRFPVYDLHNQDTKREPLARFLKSILLKD